MADDQLSGALQESLLTLLATNDLHGGIAASLVSPEYFDEVYRDIAARCIEHHHRYHRAPGEAHLDDVFDYILDDPQHKKYKTYRSIMLDLTAQARAINPEYVVNRVSSFIRRQTLKGAVLKSAQRYQQGGESVEDDVEKIMFDALKLRTEALDPGVFLSDRSRALDFLDQSNVSFSTGIYELDRYGIGPARGEMLILMAPKGRGKTWGAISFGTRAALLQRARVCHITLEMSEPKIIQRYFQQMFALSKRDERYLRHYLKFNDMGQLAEIVPEIVRPNMSLDDPKIEKYLYAKMHEWGGRFDNLLVKRFPTRSLTIRKLEAYLDSIDLIHRFVPDVLIIDYPDLMLGDDRQEHRIAIGRLFEECRRIGIERNMAVIAPTQVNREGAKSNTVEDWHMSEDWSKGMTADTLLTYSQSKFEHQLNLARLYVAKARDDRDRFSVFLVQDYNTGQFCLDSAMMSDSPRYDEQIEDAIEDEKRNPPMTRRESHEPRALT